MFGKGRVLIVEDDFAVVEMLKLMLSEYHVEVATNGFEAVEKYKTFEPDVVLMDIVMPVMDGIKATKEILSIDKNAKVIGITAFGKHKGDEMLEAGAVHILEKPITKKSLTNSIDKYLQLLQRYRFVLF